MNSNALDLLLIVENNRRSDRYSCSEAFARVFVEFIFKEQIFSARVCVQLEVEARGCLVLVFFSKSVQFWLLSSLSWQE